MMIIFIVLGAFAKLLTTLISFVISVRIKQLGHHWMNFDEISYSGFSKTCLENSSFIKI
jgi:hypothetical protein